MLKGKLRSEDSFLKSEDSCGLSTAIIFRDESGKLISYPNDLPESIQNRIKHKDDFYFV
jgi:hypothetical protein